jgi:DNA sulfur modification protein DndD
MILEQLILRNFGVFRGSQTFHLAPVQKNGRHRPIVLFGGINGGGKTTLFDAIQLVLYGSRARCSKRASLSYEDFLRQSIHHGVPPEEGAGIALSFQYTLDGEVHKYEVRRNWLVEEGKVRENLLVLQGELANYSLTRSWPQLVEELIPLEISQLFFFDGEKIRTLAEDATSSAALGGAIKSLLGLDVVERLIADATVLQGRLAKQAAPSAERAEAEALEEQYRRLRSEFEALQADRASLENRRQRAEIEAKEAEETFAAAGGRHWEERNARLQRLGELKSLAGELQAQLVALSAAELPLALVPDLLAGVDQQDRLEQAATEAEVVCRLLAERDERLLGVLRVARAPQEVLELVRDYLARDRQARQPAESIAHRLALSDAARSLLHHLRRPRLAELVSAAGQLLDKLAQVEREREDLERSLAATPPDAEIGALTERLKGATQALALFEEQARQFDETVAARKTALTDVEGKLRRLWEGRLGEEFERDDSARMMQLAGQTRTAMQDFLQRATERKIDRLSNLITESFRFLLRKQILVERILIDPTTFAVTLYDAAGRALPRQRLSEGEKQIFAVSMLWGLARASARPLPAVIDTPMARLDAAHRHNLVERYFPNASHQVLVFSTDTEVDRHYYELLRPATARAYHLRYDDQAQATTGEEGYFWKE